MSVDSYNNCSLREYGNLFVNGQAEGVLQVLFVSCVVEYDGRGESFLDEGERMIVWKPDGNFQVHADEKFKPINYQPTGADTTVEYNEESNTLKFVSERTSPDEVLTVRCQRVYSLVQYDAEDTAELDLSGTEKDMQMAIMDNPSLVENGFEPVDYEYDIGLGAVDVFGYDANENPVIVEIKRRKAQIKHIDQLYRYVEWYAEEENASVRGILVAPETSTNAEDTLERRGLDFVELNPLTVSSE